MGGRGSYALRRTVRARFQQASQRPAVRRAITPVPARRPVERGTGGGGEVTFTGDVRVSSGSLNESEISSILGRTVSHKDITRMIGAPDGSSVSISIGPNGTVSTRTNHPYISAQERVIRKDSDGSVSIYNAYFRTNTSAPKGTGSRIFAAQVSQARELGVSNIKVSAAGDPRSRTFNGYTTWAKLGYNANLTIGQRASLPSNLSKARTLNELHSLSGGAAWWKANGNDFSGTFNLQRNSPQVRVLDAYFRSRNLISPLRFKGDRSTTAERARLRRSRRS